MMDNSITMYSLREPCRVLLGEAKKLGTPSTLCQSDFIQMLEDLGTRLKCVSYRVQQKKYYEGICRKIATLTDWCRDIFPFTRLASEIRKVEYWMNLYFYEHPDSDTFTLDSIKTFCMHADVICEGLAWHLSSHPAIALLSEEEFDAHVATALKNSQWNLVLVFYADEQRRLGFLRVLMQCIEGCISKFPHAEEHEIKDMEAFANGCKLYLPCAEKVFDVDFKKQAVKGNLQAVKMYVEVFGMSPHELTEMAKLGPVLSYAAMGGNLLLVKYLVEAHAVDVEALGASGYTATPLARAAREGDCDIAKYLIEQGARVDHPWATVLCDGARSRSLAMVSLLASKGSRDINSALNIAIEIGVLEIAQFLVIQGGVTCYKNQPLLKAARSGNHLLLKYLVGELNLKLASETTTKPRDLVLAVAGKGNVAILRYLNDDMHIDIASLINEEMEASPCEAFCCLDTTKLILGRATNSNSVPLLRYLWEELKISPPSNLYNKLIAVSWTHPEANSYLLAQKMLNSDEKKCLSNRCERSNCNH